MSVIFLAICSLPVNFVMGTLKNFSLTKISHGHLPFLSTESCDYQQVSLTYSALLLKKVQTLNLHLPSMLKSLMAQLLSILFLQMLKHLMTTAIKYSCHGLSQHYKTDIVWDIYKADSLKQSTREKRGQGVRRKVSGKAKVPSNFKDFLRDSKNKQEFLSQKVTDKNYPSSKELYITSGIIHTLLCYLL